MAPARPAGSSHSLGPGREPMAATCQCRHPHLASRSAITACIMIWKQAGPCKAGNVAGTRMARTQSADQYSTNPGQSLPAHGQSRTDPHRHGHADGSMTHRRAVGWAAGRRPLPAKPAPRPCHCPRRQARAGAPQPASSPRLTREGAESRARGEVGHPGRA